ncbi:hypothetical protein NVIE_2467 [Nitrososphaera viennensis EN76]|uniref:Uncharacterized protein n=1 Tax=Nitrososphaera viennensis EN76 TaxID=926571 RepID=A0A060HNC7_9ARCH|nr:hypothetical protein NVIE_2467 [Nitrososphaera viennensis EN76]
MTNPALEQTLQLLPGHSTTEEEFREMTDRGVLHTTLRSQRRLMTNMQGMASAC